MENNFSIEEKIVESFFESIRPKLKEARNKQEIINKIKIYFYRTTET